MPIHKRLKTYLKMTDWIELDEDNRKREPKNGLFCIRCKRPIKETQAFESFISVEIKDDGGLPTMVKRKKSGALCN